MDIERYKKLAIPKIEAGKMTQIVCDAIKSTQTSEQDIYEKKKEEFKLQNTKKIEKEIDEISN